VQIFNRRVRWGSHKHEPHWFDLGRVDVIPADLQEWLLTKGSLTQKVISRCKGRFHLEIIQHGRVRPQLNERRLLMMSDTETALRREVVLCCDATPLIFARTIIPGTTLRGAGLRLARLGRKPLGDLLFRDHSVLRSDLQVTCMDAKNALFDSVKVKTKAKTNKQDVWGRRSIFFYADEPLLVSEIFLPAIRNL